MYSTEDILELERVFFNLNYASVVVASCWAYDYFLTFSDEVLCFT
ncbi:hypothetical protein AZE42_07055 [Rhizopogon vesiculosus]|uniref:Uncharacterized protein n=1 Tax=Rhizopogon vesiculosus TaxID=180088 RepID=A0A1J8PVT4_9AGAM|nr:hypothetical protein AZE42_07055 [Rhizopogon vesiculosus]